MNRSIALLNERLLDFYKLSHVAEIRQLGMMIGIELGGFSEKERIGHKVILAARKRGVILRPLGDVIVLMPPLSISPAELEKLLRVTYDSIREVTE